MSWIRPGARTFLLGDSHMQALGPRLVRELRDRGIEADYEARPGWTVARYVASGDVPALVRGADTVVVELGGNDASVGRTPAQHRADVRAMLRLIGPKHVVWVGTGLTNRPELESRRRALQPVQRDEVRAAGGAWVDGEPHTSRDLLRSDGVHYTLPAGYDSFAASLLPRLLMAPAIVDRWPWLRWAGWALAIGSTATVAVLLIARFVW